MTCLKKILPLTAIAAVALSGTAQAKTFNADAAMKAGIAVYAKSGIEGKSAKASKIRVDCGPLGKVGHTASCTGSFTLTRNGISLTYTLTSKAGVFHNTPNSFEYHVAAKASRAAAGMPKSTGTFAGFYAR